MRPTDGKAKWKREIGHTQKTPLRGLRFDLGNVGERSLERHQHTKTHPTTRMSNL